MIEAYFSEALKLHDWSEEERSELDAIKATIYQAVTEAY
jgi:hypothetical protein